MLGDTSYDTSKARSLWPKWVYREMTGYKQARGKRFDTFLAALEAAVSRDDRAATSSGEGLKPTRSGVRYYKNAEELLDRLTELKSARQAGNTSAELRNEAGDILDNLLDDGDIDESARQAGNTSAELRNEAGDILDNLLDDGDIDESVFKALWEIFE